MIVPFDSALQDESNRYLKLILSLSPGEFGTPAQCEIMELQWQPSYVMQDAQQSSYNAIKRLFPDIEVLMCYYHVTENIRKKCKPYISNREDVYDELKAAVHEMHMSSSEEEYEQLKKEFKDTFKRYKDLLAYMDA